MTIQAGPGIAYVVARRRHADPPERVHVLQSRQITVMLVHDPVRSVSLKIILMVADHGSRYLFLDRERITRGPLKRPVRLGHQDPVGNNRESLSSVRAGPGKAAARPANRKGDQTALVQAAERRSVRVAFRLRLITWIGLLKSRQRHLDLGAERPLSFRRESPVSFLNQRRLAAQRVIGPPVRALPGIAQVLAAQRFRHRPEHVDIRKGRNILIALTERQGIRKIVKVGFMALDHGNRNIGLRRKTPPARPDTGAIGLEDPHRLIHKGVVPFMVSTSPAVIRLSPADRQRNTGQKIDVGLGRAVLVSRIRCLRFAVGGDFRFVVISLVTDPFHRNRFLRRNAVTVCGSINPFHLLRLVRGPGQGMPLVTIHAVPRKTQVRPRNDHADPPQEVNVLDRGLVLILKRLIFHVARMPQDPIRRHALLCRKGPLGRSRIGPVRLAGFIHLFPEGIADGPILSIPRIIDIIPVRRNRDRTKRVPVRQRREIRVAFIHGGRAVIIKQGSPVLDHPDIDTFLRTERPLFTGRVSPIHLFFIDPLFHEGMALGPAAAFPAIILHFAARCAGDPLKQVHITESG